MFAVAYLLRSLAIHFVNDSFTIADVPHIPLIKHDGHYPFIQMSMFENLWQLGFGCHVALVVSFLLLLKTTTQGTKSPRRLR